MIRGAPLPLQLCFVAQLALAAPWVAHAQDVQAPPTVVVVFEGEWSGTLRDDLWGDLGAMLRDRAIRLVAATSEPSMRLATVRIEAPDARGSVRVVIEDQLTAKVVERTLDLSGEEPDTWSTVIAAGADELLRASWVELSMRSAPPPAQPPPPEVERIVEETLAPARHEARVGGALRAEVMLAERAVASGGSVGVTVEVDPHVVLGAHVAIDALLPETSARARIDGVLALGDVEIAAPLLSEGEPIQLSLVGLGRIGAAWMRASAAPGLAATDDVGFLALAGGGVRFGVVLDTVRLELGGLVLAPLASVRGSDGLQDLIAIVGPVGLVQLGVELRP